MSTNTHAHKQMYKNKTSPLLTNLRRSPSNRDVALPGQVFTLFRLFSGESKVGNLAAHLRAQQNVASSTVIKTQSRGIAKFYVNSYFAEKLKKKNTHTRKRKIKRGGHRNLHIAM